MFACVLFMIFCLNELLRVPDHLPPTDFVRIQHVHCHTVPFPQVVESENKMKCSSQFDFSLKSSSYICFFLLLFMPGILKYVSLLCLLKSYYRLGSTRVNTTKLKFNGFSQSSFIMKLFSGVLTDAHHFPLFPVLSGLGIPPVFLFVIPLLQ